MLRFLKSKTINFALLLAAFGAAQANLASFQAFLTPEQYGKATIVIAVIVAVLRYVTTQPLSEK